MLSPNAFVIPAKAGIQRLAGFLASGVAALYLSLEDRGKELRP
jgi:hypothetical protein